MTSVTFWFFGPPEEKHVHKLHSMQTVADALQAISTKFKPALIPHQCEVKFKKQPVDLNTPFRLLNIPAGSKLEIIKRDTPGNYAKYLPAAGATARPSRAATAESAFVTSQLPASATTVGAGAGATVPPAPQAAAPAGSSSPNSQPQQPAPETQQPRAEAIAAPPAAAEPPQPPAAQAEPSAAPSVVPALAATSAAPSTVSTAAAAGPGSSTSPAAQTAVPGTLAALGVQVPVYVFHQQALEAAATQTPRSMDAEPPDEFFELTPEDLALMQQQANEKKKQEAVFRSRAARDADASARASALGPVRVRLHFPDGTLMQTSFKATDQLQAVQDLVHRCANPQLAPGLYLYTTPPKTLLRDLGATLYSLQLVPAAHIHVGIDDRKLAGSKMGSASASTQPATGPGPAYTATGPFLRPEVQALMQNCVPQEVQPKAAESARGVDGGVNTSGSSNQAAAVAEAQRQLRVAAAASRQAGSSSDDAGGSKVPKWLRIGKK